jgi:molecular chaperone DnaK (HSP70)
MPNKTCQNCNQWTPLDADEICSWCGCRLSFHAEVDPCVVYDLTSHHTVVYLNLSNYRSSALCVQTIECSVDGLLAQKDTKEIEIESKQRIPLELNLSGVDFTRELWVELTITAVPAEKEMMEGKATSYRENARFCLSSEPSLNIQNQPLKVVVDDSENTSELREVTVSIESGAMPVAQLRTLENVPWIKLEQRAKTALLAASLTEDACKQIQVPFWILREKLMEAIGSEFPSELSFTLTVSGGPGRLEVPAGIVKLHLQYPPKLRVERARFSRDEKAEIWTLKPTEVLWDHRESRMTELRVKLENIGDSPLVLEGVRLPQNYSWAHIGPQSLELGARGTDNPPSTASLYISLDANQAYRFCPETMEIEMMLKGAEGTPPTARIQVPFKHAELETFDGIVAIDFGTSTTTCAFQVNSANPNAQLEAEETKIPGVPTAIFYEDWSETQGPVCQIGRKAQLAAASSAGTLVTEIKRRLGSPKGIEVRFAKKPSLIKEYKPEEIAGHFLREYRRLIESTLKKAVEKCVITHPVFFLDSSVLALQKAFRDAGFSPQGSDEEEGSDILVEPVAAAFKFISEDVAKNKTNREIRLAVFDFGGGTTDFTLMKARYSFDGRTPEVLATIEEVGGERFGGHDVTLKLAYYLLKRWNEHRKSPHEVQPVSVPLTLEAIAKEKDPSRFVAGLLNREIVLTLAEQAKLELSEAAKASIKGTLGQEEIDFAITIEEFNNEIRDDLTTLTSSFKEMIESNPSRKLDVVVVSGNSSRLPLVLPLLKETFPGVLIHPVPEPNDRFPGKAQLKESIVNGLLEHAKIRRNLYPDFALDDNSSLGMPNTLIVNIGVMNETSSLPAYFHEVINKTATLPTDWVQVSPSLRKDNEIFLLAMGGRSNKALLRISENGSRRWNSRIQPLGTIQCSKLPRPERGWRQCTAEVQVEQNRSVRFRISQDGKPIHEQVLAPEIILD